MIHDRRKAEKNIKLIKYLIQKIPKYLKNYKIEWQKCEISNHLIVLWKSPHLILVRIDGLYLRIIYFTKYQIKVFLLAAKPLPKTWEEGEL